MFYDSLEIYETYSVVFDRVYEISCVLIVIIERSIIRNTTSEFCIYCNVEYCETVKAVKYIYKYIYKGPDQLAYQIKEKGQAVDEIIEYLNDRYMGDTKAGYQSRCLI